MITQKELKKVLKYSKTTGVFSWKIARGGNNIGDKAGTLKDGYIRIRINNKNYYAHRLVWLYVYGEHPLHHIDHKNHNKNDNRFKNLREVTHKENHKNQSIPKHNTSGIVGVVWHKIAKKWNANIRIDKKLIHLGTFANKKDAIKARKDAEIKYGFHKNHGAKK